MSKNPKGKDTAIGSSQPRTYRYTQEISQMMFVAGEVQDPLIDTVRQVEDIVRGQVIELAIRARQIAARRGSRNLAAEDLIFLIRDDRAKVNRLRTYLSWKDVRKNAKDSGGDGGQVGSGPGGGGPGGEEEHADGDDALKPKTRQRQIVKLPWEVTTVYADFLRHFKGTRGLQRVGEEEDSEEDEDELEANEDMLQRLKAIEQDADLVTKNMSREEYSHYSDCRQASFTYRKAKRFREFVNLSAYLDVKPNDDIIDILGFLCYEMVHTLCTSALKVKSIYSPDPSSSTALLPLTSDSAADSSSNPLKRTLSSTNGINPSPPKKRPRPDSVEPAVCTLFERPSQARAALTPAHITEAFGRIQESQGRLKGVGIGNFRGAGPGRRRLVLF